MNIKVVSFNIRYDNPKDGPNAWPLRRERVGSWLLSEQADYIGLQEVLPHQRAHLDEMLTGYRSYGISRDGSGRDEQCVCYIREPWWFEEALTWWLSTTPDVPSRGWDARLPRVCSMARVVSPQGRWWGANLHLDHEGAMARERGLDLISRNWPADLPGILLGDFNQENPLATLQGLPGWKDAQVESGQPELATFHDFQGGREGQRIDMILYSPQWALKSFQVHQDPALSDHYPLVAQLEARPA